MNNRLDQRGIANALTIPLIGLGILVVILLVVLVYSLSQLSTARSQREEYAQTEVKEARDAIRAELQKEFDVKEKLPFLDYEGPDLLGGIKFQYPKTWSAAVEQSENSSIQLDGYFHPGVIRTDNEQGRSYALRLQLINSPYSQEVRRYQNSIKNGELKSRAVTFVQTEGVRLDGQLETVDKGSMVILPLRDKTLKIWTESPDFLADYNKILETFTFNP